MDSSTVALRGVYHGSATGLLHPPTLREGHPPHPCPYLLAGIPSPVRYFVNRKRLICIHWQNHDPTSPALKHMIDNGIKNRENSASLQCNRAYMRMTMLIRPFIHQNHAHRGTMTLMAVPHGAILSKYRNGPWDCIKMWAILQQIWARLPQEYNNNSVII